MDGVMRSHMLDPTPRLATERLPLTRVVEVIHYFRAYFRDFESEFVFNLLFEVGGSPSISGIAELVLEVVEVLCERCI